MVTLSNDISATINIELRSKIKNLQKENARLSGVNCQLKRKLNEARDLIHKYGLGRHNQHVNKQTSLVKIKPYQIQAIVENYFNLPYNSVLVRRGERDNRMVAKARQFYVHFLLKYTTISKKEVSRILGYKDHTTIQYVEKIMAKLQQVPTRNFLELYEPIEKAIEITMERGKVVRMRQKKPISQTY